MSVSSENFYKKHLTNVVEWQKMGAASIFSAESRLELINGEIIEMSPIGSHHAGYLKRLNRFFSRQIQDSELIAIQDPLRLNDLSEPQPDFMLLRSRSDLYYESHPTADDVLLLIEVAESSLQFDQNQKLRLYALHNIPEYWVLNANNACIEIYRQPVNGAYAKKTTLRAGDKITLSQLDHINIELADIL